MTGTRTIGGSDLKTPPLIFGGNVLGWTTDRDTSFAVLDAFVAGGGTMIDTADIYSAWGEGHRGGESEEMIGAWLRHRGRRDDVQITTKVGMLPIDGVKGLSPSHIAKAVEASLKRLGTDYIDLYLAHQDDQEQDQGVVAEAFGALVKAGKVRWTGASNFSVERLSGALAAQEKAGVSPYVALQNKYNLLDRQAYDGAMRDFCLEHGIGLTPYFGLAAGYLTGKYRTAADLEGQARGEWVRPYFEGNGPSVLAALDRVAEETGASLPQIALAWVAAQPGVAAPIASASSVEQMEEMMGAIHLTLDAEHLQILGEAGRVAETA